MKILSIGNSFSQDAQRYLHSLGEVNGKNIKCVNLYIGGCTLRQHYLNLLDDEKSYKFEYNGSDTGIQISIKEALKSDEWDYVTIQQASHKSFDFDTYIPYIQKLKEYVETYSPKSKIALHQTWAYPENKNRIKEVGFNSTREMYEAVREAYLKVEELICPDTVIKSGEAMMQAYNKFGNNLYRDDIHASLGIGRYLLGYVWYKTLIGELPKNDVKCFDVELTNEQMQMIRKTVCTVLTRSEIRS